MVTVLVQINNIKAYRFLEDLEDLQLIKVLKKSATKQKSLADKYAGKLPAKVVDQLHQLVTQSRNEWNKRSA